MDEQYCQERNRFIPYAVKHANLVVGERYPKGSTIAEREAWYIKWNHIYFAEMDRLWKEWLLAKPRYERRAEESKGMKMAEWIRTHFERLAKRLKMTVEELEKDDLEVATA
jgi:hypothetical protein